MKISTAQLEAILANRGNITPPSELVDTTVIKLVDKELIDQVTKDILAMNDREQMIADLKARIESGEYNPSSEDIADAMVRRHVADQIR